jgi:hexosaminidase
VNVLPQPQQVTLLEGTTTLVSPLRVFAWEWQDEVAAWAEDLAKSTRIDVEFVDIDEADIVFSLASDIDGYRLVIDGAVHILCSWSDGVTQALTTLRQLGPVELYSAEQLPISSFDVPNCEVSDWPAFGWRGAHLDVARHFWDVETVKRYVDLLVMHKLNILHLHLNDDQGWRVEIPNWPKLTSVGAWRDGSPIGHEDDDRRDTVRHGGFYTREELEDISAYCARRGVSVVPEIDLPGHAQAVLAAYPELGNNPEVTLEVWQHWGISDHVLNVSTEALDFAVEVVSYVASIFPNATVHIGGDECPTTEWEASEHAKAVMEQHGFKSAQQLQGLFTSKLCEVLEESGHQVIAWDEVLDAEVPETTVIAAWRSVEKAIEAVDRGHYVVMMPMQYVYFDWLSSEDPSEPIAVHPAPFVTTWEKTYSFEVTPPELNSLQRRQILGAQAQLWTEYITTRDRMDYMAYPRLSAFSEVVWGTQEELSAFRPRLVSHLERLRAAGVKFRPLDSGE